MKIVKAQLYPYEPGQPFPQTDADAITVDFNPSTLRVALRNNIRAGAGANRDGNKVAEVASEGSSSLSLELVFDTTETGADVRERLVQIVERLIVPQKGEQDTWKPSGCLFVWGTFVFGGLVASYQETLDFFSADGVPLRATVALSIEHDALQYSRLDSNSTGAGGRPAIREFSSDWRRDAAANDTESPRAALGAQSAQPAPSGGLMP